MANEHVLLIENEIPYSMTCADGTGIERGTLLKLTDPNTVAASAAAEDICAGVAAEEKIASDGKTAISVYRGGRFKAVASGSITAGDALITAVPAGTNLLAAAGVNSEDIVGISMETVTAGETFEYELKPRTINVA